MLMGEATFGEQHNCMLAVLEYDLKFWAESECKQSLPRSCVCEYTRDPVVTLRGFCSALYEEKAVDSKFLTLQNRSDPKDFHWQGDRHSTLKFDSIATTIFRQFNRKFPNGIWRLRRHSTNFWKSTSIKGLMTVPNSF